MEHLFRSLSLLLDNDKSYVVVLDDFHCITNREILGVFSCPNEASSQGYNTLFYRQRPSR